MKKEVDRITKIVMQMVEKTKMDVCLTAESSGGNVDIQFTLIPTKPIEKKAGF